MDCTVMIVVRDVEASSRWYQELLGLTSGHGGKEFEMLMGDGRLQLMLHHRGFVEHPASTDPREGESGRGVLLYFSVSAVDEVFERAGKMGADMIDEPHENPNARALEFSLRDPDGYAISVSQRLG